MNSRTLGTIAMICAPALLVEGLLLQGKPNAVITGIAGMVFMAGWICSNTAMRRMQLTGTGRWGQAVLLVQLFGLVLAFMFGFFEAMGLLEGTLVFAVTDAAWPLSMLWMLVVGIAVIRAGRLYGWRRYVPVLCPFWMLVAIVGSAAFGEVGNYLGVGYAAVTWALLGLVVYGAGRERSRRRPNPQSGNREDDQDAQVQRRYQLPPHGIWAVLDRGTADRLDRRSGPTMGDGRDDGRLPASFG